MRVSSVPNYGFFIVCAVCILASDAHGQTPIEITSEPACKSCELLAEPLVRLGTLDGPGAIGRLGTIARDFKGRFHVVSIEFPTEILVFDSTGTYLTTFGTEGPGPGEYGNIFHLTAVDSLVYAFDIRHQRMTRLTLEGQVLGTTRIPANFRDAAIITDSLVAVSAHVRTPELAGLLLHLINGRGEIVRSFGEPGLPIGLDPDRPYAMWRELAPADSMGFWSARKSKYSIERWNRAGEKLAVFVRRPEWFPAHGKGPGFTPDHPPRPILMDINIDADDRVWTLIAVADRDWQDALVWSENHPHGARYVVDDYNAYFDTIVEVLGPSSQSLITSRRLNLHFSEFADDAHIAAYVSSKSIPQVAVWRMRLHQNSKLGRKTAP